MEKSGETTHGWLYLFRNNRFGLQYARKSLFILQDNCLKSFKAVPASPSEEPLRSAIIDSCIRVVDNGRESHRRKIFYTFTIYNTSNHNDRLKLGVTSSEEAARWIHSLQDAALNPGKVSSSERKWQPFSMSVSKRRRSKRSFKWNNKSTMQVNAIAPDVMAPSPWKIFGCQNGLRLFKEAKDKDSNGKRWDSIPAIMAVGVIDGTSEAVFRTIMCLGASRAEWDFCFYRGSVVEHLDGHTDIIHMQLYNHWLPWGAKRRDLLLRRYWRREGDGTYVILYHSVFHRKCPPQPGYVRACVHSGGYLITPMQQGKQCIMKHMLAIDWKFWKSYLKKSPARSITIRMVVKIAALREMFHAKSGNAIGEYESSELSRDNSVVGESKAEAVKGEFGFRSRQKVSENETLRPQKSEASSLMALSEVTADQFFDVPESDDETLETDGEMGILNPEYTYTEPKFSSSTANLVKKLHGFGGQRKGYVELQDVSKDESPSTCYGSTLPKDSSFNMPCSWAPADPSSFLIRGNKYLVDNRKVKASSTLMEMVAADWLQSDKPEYNIAGRDGGLVQKYAARSAPEFFLVINIQVPGASESAYSLVMYYMLKTPLEKTPLLARFVNGDDAFRNSRLKLIPYISKGSWIVKQSVGKKSCLIGQALETRYFRGQNYLEVCVDVGSSTVARGVVSLVLGYLNKLVVEMAFVLQGNTKDELPEFLLGACRLNCLDASKSVYIGHSNSNTTHDQDKQ